MQKNKHPSPPNAPPMQPIEVYKQISAAFPIVGIGASAGGLEAFEQFFRYLPADSGMAFVLVPHLDPTHASLLTEILQRTAAIPVHEAQDQVLVEPNQVYVIPPNRDMAIFHGILQLTLPEQPRGQRLPIDAFLRSLAEDRQDKAIGIILSGTGTDGTLGLRAILGAGGVTLVQEPSTAKYDGMPSSAIQAGYATHVLAADKMPETLLANTRCFSAHPETPAAAPQAASGINHILMQLRATTGHDFSLYKKSTISRRIERRMSQHALEDTGVYARYLKEHPEEVHLLFKELLINVTSFFRDMEAFAVLERQILPPLCDGRPADAVFRVWVAGCATGEEAYSIAMLLRERMDATNQEFKVQIYSTDLDDDAISIARTGIYPPNIAQDVTPERLRRFFIKEEAGFRIKKDIREMVVFAVQNLIKDPPFTKLDLLSCRNVLIYLEPELQNRLIPAFHYALKPGGVLFLSPSESIGNYTDLFSSLNRKWKFYRAAQTSSSILAVMSGPLTWAAQSNDKAPEELINKPKETNFAELTRRMLLQFFAPASVVTDLKGDILYVHGETGAYLRPAPGRATLNAVEMARDGLASELRAAINAAVEGTATLNREIGFKTNGDFSTVSLTVRPLPGPGGERNLLLLSFQTVAATHKPKAKHVAKPAATERIEELELDLAYLKENHQASIEEQQASNEELKSANEELQSTNEELQSTNEELETSKEELQSVNEELITVNAELQSKIEQLAGMQNDMKNLLDSINIGIIFLDRHLIIRRFTREALRIYRLVASDIGRPLNDIKPLIEGDDLLVAAKAVLESLIPYERELRIGGDSWMLARIQPYRTLDNVIDGVVLTFTDISSRILAIATQQALMLAEGIVDTIPEPFIVLDSTLKVISANTAFYREFQTTAEETVGLGIYQLDNRQWDNPSLRELLETLFKNGQAADVRMEQDFATIGHRTLLLNARRIAGEPQLLLLSMEVLS